MTKEEAERFVQEIHVRHMLNLNVKIIELANDDHPTSYVIRRISNRTKVKKFKKVRVRHLQTTSSISTSTLFGQEVLSVQSNTSLRYS